jgi:hypothetical protein
MFLPLARFFGPRSVNPSNLFQFPITDPGTVIALREDWRRRQMIGRRSHPRFSLGQAWSGAVRVLRDVTVCRTAEAELLAVSQAPGVIGEQMTLALIASVGSLTLRVQVLESRPVIMDSALRHRVRLGIVWETARNMPDYRVQPHASTRNEVTNAVDVLLQANDVVGVVGRHVPVRLIDLSTSGCLLESWVRLDVGTHATVRVAHDDREFTDDVRVTRSQPSAASGLFHVGVEFLWTKPPTERSIRTILSRFDGGSLQQARLGGLHM